jgi:hypothetical protein
MRLIVNRTMTAACVCLFLWSGPATAQDGAVRTDPGVGTWHLNLEQSKFPGGRPQIEVRRYWVRDDGFLVGLAISIDAQGNPNFVQFAAKDDGRDYPEYNAPTLAELQAAGTTTPIMYAQRNIDRYTAEVTLKRDGRITTSGTRTISEDGRTMTIVLSTTNPAGETVTTVRVFDRQ